VARRRQIVDLRQRLPDGPPLAPGQAGHGRRHGPGHPGAIRCWCFGVLVSIAILTRLELL
jgi:hypothetical protein